ncbi:MAG TPA: hypothetical protein VKA08_02285 [Balneolales bacterium]|nr:hypothetical protein [Balneolales bacterium]
MLENSYRLPFTIKDLEYGLKEAVGFLRFDKNHLILELQQQDAFVGALKSDVQNLKISFSEIQEIKIDKGMFSTNVIIEGSHMASLSEVPGSKQGNVELKIDRKNKKEADRVISALNLALSEYRLNQMDEDS